MLSSFFARRCLSSVTQTSSDGVSFITLNRPAVMNAIDAEMPSLLEDCVKKANDDDAVKLLVLQGAGGNFCAGYDLKKYAEAPRGSELGSQKMPWDPYVDFKMMWGCTQHFMSIWRSLKPVIGKIQGVCVGGGSDIALLCDLTLASSDSRIGYPPAKLWGCPTTAMWAYRVGLENAKRLLLTGDLISGSRAAEIGLIGEAVPDASLDQALQKLIDSMIDIPTNQLFFQKQVINSIFESANLANTQRLATFIDGMTRHTPEGVEFQQKCESLGFKEAVRLRDNKKN